MLSLSLSLSRSIHFYGRGICGAPPNMQNRESEFETLSRYLRSLSPDMI